MATDDNSPGAGTPNEDAAATRPAQSHTPANEQPTDAIGAQPTTPIEAPAASPAVAGPAGVAPATGSTGVSTKNKLIAGAAGGAIVVAGVFFGLGYWTGDATNDNHGHHRMSHEWNGGNGRYGGEFGNGGPGMRHMRGNGGNEMPPGMQAPGNNQQGGTGQVPGNGQAPTTGQQTPNAPTQTQAPAPSA